MARSDFTTWLPLDRWAEIIGVNPLHFNQLYSETYMQNNVCGEVWFQYSWQHSDRIGREDIAMAIQQAEQRISKSVGYNLIPEWEYNERLPYPHPQVPGAWNVWGTNQNAMLKSVELPRGHIISGGIRAKTLLQAGAAIVRSDQDVDGFQETCTVIVATTITDTNEIRVYYPAKSGEDGWEIKPIKVSISGGNATIIFKVWQVAAANQMDALNASTLDADDPASYETTCDVYRVYNDPSSQVSFLWEPSATNCCGSSTCTACQLETQTGCFHLRDARLGLAVPSPASWNAASASFDASEWAACREPDQVMFSYYSGYRDNHLARPYVEMARYWEYAVAYYAASLLDRSACGCSNVSEFIDKWRRDAAFVSQEEGGFNVTPEMSANQLGTTAGALYAYRQIQRYGVRVAK